jgi:hypothetical protein
LWLTLDAGKFARVDYDRNKREVTIRLDPATSFAPRAYLTIESTKAAASYRPAASFAQERGRYVIPLESGEKAIVLQPTR